MIKHLKWLSVIRYCATITVLSVASGHSIQYNRSLIVVDRCKVIKIMADNCIFCAKSKTSSGGKVNKTVIEIRKAFPLGAAITAINFEMTRLHCFLHYLNPRITFRGNPLKRKLVFAIFMYFNVILAGLKEIIRSIMAGMSLRWFNATCYTVFDAWSIIFSVSFLSVLSFGTGNLMMVSNFWLGYFVHVTKQILVVYV